MNQSSSRVREVPDLVFPDMESPLKEHHDSISWSQWMDETEDRLHTYLLKHDSPQRRLETKIHKRFVLR